MRPNRLLRHFSTKHVSFKEKLKEFFAAKSQKLKCMKLDSTGSAAQSSHRKLQAASYELFVLIAKETKSHTIGATLVKPCLLKAADVVLGTDSRKKLSQIPLSDNTVKRRNDDMAEDIKNQVVDAIKKFTFFVIQLDESTDVAQCSNLIVYVHYIENERMKDELMFSTELLTTTKAVDVMKAVSDFFEKHVRSWQKLIGVCTDGAPSMLGSRSGFVQLVKEKNADLVGIHCFIQRQTLAAKTLPNELNAVLKLCITVVNYVKNSVSNTRLFRSLCVDLGSDNKTLLFHTEVRWLSKGNMLGRLFELRDGVVTFLALHKQNELSAEFKKPSNQVILAYLSDFFDTLNNLNFRLQGADSNIVTHRVAIKMYVEKLHLWIRKVSMNPSIYSSFSKVVSVSEEACFEDVFEGPLLKNLIIDHLKNLKEKFSRYFPNLSEEFYKLSTDPFNMDIQLLPEELREKGVEIKNDSAARYDFEKMDKLPFWLKY
ncbi:protein FAM200C-like [Diorhabda carinulata]|uniref:protein FAM200C-like n=1 Tax=Diorhabda carinulata TaxID=1163345 RepID=UPI0025A02980|nr:protein FAM200C-like [Diorhabda carinulata]